MKDVELKGLPKLKPKENEDDPDEYVNIDDPNIKDEDKYEILYTREKPLHIQIHRLNDYIIGLEVSFKKDGKNQTIWHLTDRTYGSMGFPPEVFNIPTIYLNLFYMGQQTNGDTAEMQPILTWYYDNNITITVSSDYEYKIYDNLDLKKVFSVSIGVVKIVDVRLINNRSLQILLEKPAEADFQIKLTSNVRFASYLTDEFRKNYVMIKTQTHDFEAAIKLDNKEYFNIPIIYLNNFKIEIKPVEKIYYNETETFEIPIIYLNKLNIKVNLLEQKQYYYNENDIFKIPIIYLDEIRFEVKPYGLDPV